MKLILFISILSLQTLQAKASGCDWYADGSPYIERTEIIREIEITPSDISMICLAYGKENCIMQLTIQGDSNIYRKEISGGQYHSYDESLPNSDFAELKQIKSSNLLTAKLIYENVYGSFDDNCAGPYPPLSSGRYQLQLKHKVSKKIWSFYFVNWLQPDRMIQLFKNN